MTPQEKESFAQAIELMILNDYISREDVIVIMKKGTAKMLGEDEKAIFI